MVGWCAATAPSSYLSAWGQQGSAQRVRCDGDSDQMHAVSEQSRRMEKRPRRWIPEKRRKATVADAAWTVAPTRCPRGGGRRRQRISDWAVRPCSGAEDV
uniref:Uncharacterized protein n=1 Tax=Leersia perrieri TaxID=77586 RepID=A0A0D9Y043_9ORYZ